MKWNKLDDGHGRVVNNILGRIVSAKYGANSSSASSANISSSSGETVVVSDSRVLSNVLGVARLGASSPNASASFSRCMRDCRFCAFFSNRYLLYISERLSLFLIRPGLLVTARFFISFIELVGFLPCRLACPPFRLPDTIVLFVCLLLLFITSKQLT